MTHQKRYTAEELRAFAIEVSAFSAAAMSERHYEESNAMNCIGRALLQAAHTESQVAGLVEAMEKIDRLYDNASVVGWTEGTTFAAIASESLSKFRGEA